MQDYSALFSALIGYWNEFAEANGYEKIEKTNYPIRSTIRRRISAEKDFLDRMPMYFKLIHKYCGGEDEFGKPLTLHSFLRTTATLRALREHERTTGKSLLNSFE